MHLDLRRPEWYRKLRLFGFLFVLPIGVWFAFKHDPKTFSQPQDLENTYHTVEKIQEHNSKTDCWIIFDEYVYDLTLYLNQHPEETQIIKQCGKTADVFGIIYPGEIFTTYKIRHIIAPYKIGKPVQLIVD